MSVGRIFVSTIMALILPVYLAHKLSVKTYGAWALIIQVSAYVGYFNLGIQAAIAKFVAEYEARGDSEGSGVHASVGLALMLASAVLGAIVTAIVAWQAPHLFNQMPPSLYHDVQLGILFVGMSLSFGLVCSSYGAIFMGIERYAVPMVLMMLNRVIFTIVVVAAVALHQGLAVMGALAAAGNVATGLLQIEAWRRWASKVKVSLRSLKTTIVKKMLAYCSTLAIWSAGMLCVSGLDLTIVGRYDFAHTAYYSIAILPTNFIVALVGSALAPLTPAASALSVNRSPAEMGALLARMTRYASILLFVLGVPLVVEGYWMLRVWVGLAYALHTIAYLRILLLGYMLRNVAMPYGAMLVATGSQKTAIASSVAEAIVNLASSIYLARHIGAIGVAYGTLLGALVCVGVNFAVNVRYTFPKMAISRAKLMSTGLLRPSVILIPSLLVAPRWCFAPVPALGPATGLAWGLSTLLLAFFIGLDVQERDALAKFVCRKMNLNMA
jgi:O-antigen/teichoic acid export membrane protein